MPPKRAAAQAKKEEDSTTGSSFKWSQIETLYYGEPIEKISNSSIMVGFDMDDTIITTKSGAKFPKDANDWKFLNDKVIDTIKKYHQDKYRIVIFTNQAGISTGKSKASDIKKKIENVTAQLGVPVTALIASEDDKYRKPVLGMWNFFTEKLNGGVTIDKTKSIFCGDAAGRLKPSKDFTDTDYKFSLNIGITFKTPEEFFLGEKSVIPAIEFQPSKLPKSGPLFKSGEKTVDSKKEMIIFCGSPASGKSSFWQAHLKKNYERVNQDTLKTKEKCLKVAEDFLKEGKAVVIDNTCPQQETRKLFIDLAKKYNYPVRCFLFNFAKDLVFHLDTLREVNPYRKHLSKKVGKITIHTWYKKLEVPTTKEGFSEVKEVNFIAGPFDNKDDEALFFQFNKGK